MPNQNILLQSLNDFMSPKVIIISIISFIITVSIILISLFILFDNSGSIKDTIPEVFMWIDEILVSIESYPFLSFILKHELAMILFRYLLYFGFGIVGYYIFFGIYGIVISFFAPMLIRHIQKRHNSTIELKGIGTLSTIFFYIKTIIVTIVLFVALSPAYLIPGLNILIFLPLYYFFHKALVFDVSSVINTSKEYKRIKRANWSELKGYTGLCFLITLVPIIGVLAYPFYIIYVGHFMLKETEELRHTDSFHFI